ncbi:MAG: nucleotidyltransferase domain-containing protein [Nitrososphaerales archaeon]
MADTKPNIVPMNNSDPKSKLDITTGLSRISKDMLDSFHDLKSIMLVGSATEKKDFKDIDLLLITKRLAFTTAKSKLMMALRSTFPNFDFDIGVYNASRLSKEVSIFLYEAKGSGIVLAGEDLRNMISIKREDLFPFEAIRLILNRAYDLMACIDYNNLSIDEAKFKAIRGRIFQTHVDVNLLISGAFAPSKLERQKIFLADLEMPLLGSWEESRLMLATDLISTLAAAAFTDIGDAIEKMRRSFRYPIENRIRNFFSYGGISSLFMSPAIPYFKICGSFLLSVELGLQKIALDKSKLDVQYRLKSQPVIPKERQRRSSQ